MFCVIALLISAIFKKTFGFAPCRLSNRSSASCRAAPSEAPPQRTRRGSLTGSALRPSSALSAGATRRTCDRMVLIGDAAGFVDSIAGDGLCIAFNSALIFGRHLPRILAHGATRQSMRPYERAACRLFRRYWLVTTALLVLARHPRARTATIKYLATHRAVCDAITSHAMRLMVSAA